ncbi:MAG: DUF4302 domain-containing protein [Muribaculaceae bacterium]|nr:DUF4302 domain-containing protein [Muribaculaceae bacterium]
MNKLYHISVLLLMAVLMFSTSCLKTEEDDIFDKSAASRLDDVRDSYTNILTEKGGKWQMEYFTTDEEPGYVYLMTFQKDGSVTISGKNVWISRVDDVSAITPSFGSETSLWEVITDNGPVLSFNSYNRFFHLFADPEDIPSTDEGDTDEQGYGHSGDYEFDLMKYSGDTLYLEGKKYGNNIIMTRLEPSIEDQTYMDDVVALADSFFNAKIPQTFITLPNDRRFVVTNGASLILSMYPEDGDWVSQTETYSAIITPSGLNFMNPVRLYADKDSTSYYDVQHFVRQADGSLLCRENNQVKFTADTLSKIMAGQSFKWRMVENGYAGDLEDFISIFEAGLKAYNKATLRYKYFDISYVAAQETFTFTFAVRANGRNSTCNLYLDVERVSDNQVRFVFNGEGDSNAKVYLQRVEALQDFCNYLSSTTFEIRPNSLLSPTEVRLVSADDDVTALTLILQ